MHPSFLVTVNSCPLCKRSDPEYFGGRWQFGYRLNYQICRFCGFVFLSPRMSDEEMTVLYRAEYRRIYNSSEAPTDDLIETQSHRAQHLACIIQDQIGSSVKSCLDIGCSTGELLKVVKTNLPNCDIVGVEPSDAHRTFCQSHGIDTYDSLDHLQEYVPERFDLIIMSHVLEHLADPLAFLIRLYNQFANTNGHILIEVPNLYGHGCFEIAHPVCFSKKTLNECLRGAGFVPIFWKVHNIPCSEDARGLYLVALAKVQSPPMSPFKPKPLHPFWVKWRRRVGRTKESTQMALYVLLRQELKRFIYPTKKNV